jgi:hypothetical protein
LFRLFFLIYNKIFREEILVLGDSHILVFNNKYFRKFYFNVVSVDGATVSGLENPNSKTQALPIFMRSIKSSKAKVVIIMIGEVDVGFVVWYRAEKYNEPVTKMLNIAIENYQKLLLKLFDLGYKVICISTPLPTIKDGTTFGEVANARKSIQAKQMERTELTLNFNNTMKVFCSNNGVIYIPLDRESLGANGLVSEHLLNASSTDHHYDNDIYAKIIGQKLFSIIATLNSHPK